MFVASCGANETPTSASAVGGPQGRVPQFVVECLLSHTAPDDPIVHPGEPGASHVHLFFGATATNAYSTYDELIAGDTSCDQKLDTASYWAPALLANDRLVEPDRSRAYYRPGPGVDPTVVRPYPAGLMLIGGDASAERAQPADRVGFSCGTGGARSSEPGQCSPGHPLTMTIVFPDCWNGNDLDSSDHVRHATYSSDGQCPAEYPVAIPQLLLAIEYPYNGDPAALSLTSGPLHTAHADFWNAWDQSKLETEVIGCINRGVVCGVVG